MAKVATKKLNLEQVLREMVREIIFEELLAEYRPGLGVPTEQFYEPEDRENEEEWWANRHQEGLPQNHDPELDMDPIDKELMMNSLLDLEFQEGQKSIPVPVVREMIRESVKSALRK